LVLRPKQEQLLQLPQARGGLKMIVRARRFSRNEVRKGLRPYTGVP
jgi:hypothetical protein